MEIINSPYYGISQLKAYYRLSNGALTTDSSGNAHTLALSIGSIAEIAGIYGGGAFFAGMTTAAAWYKFSNGALTTDSSGNSHTLTAIASPSGVTGKFGYGISLSSGDGDAYSAADHADFKPTGNFSVSAWFQTSTAADQTIFQSRSQNTNPAGFRLALNSDGTVFFQSSKNTASGASGTIQSTSAFKDGAWHHAVGTWDGTNLNLYVDGAVAATPVAWANAPVYAATNYVRVGCYNASGTNSGFMNGYLDDLVIFNGIALTLDQVNRLYAGEMTLGNAYSTPDHADFKPTSSPFTVGLWVKTPNGNADAMGLFQSYGGVTNISGWLLATTGGRPYLRVAKNTGVTEGVDMATVTATNVINDGAWHHVVATWDGSNIRIYRDGLLDAVAVAWSSALAYQATNYVRIGCRNGTGTDALFATAYMDEVFILNGTALSLGQVQELYVQSSVRRSAVLV